MPAARQPFSNLSIADDADDYVGVGHGEINEAANDYLCMLLILVMTIIILFKIFLSSNILT